MCVCVCTCVFVLQLVHVASQSMSVDATTLMASQAPPDMLLGSEDSEKKPSHTSAELKAPLETSDTTQGPEKVEDSGQSVKEDKPVVDTSPLQDVHVQEAFPGTVLIYC